MPSYAALLQHPPLPALLMGAGGVLLLPALTGRVVLGAGARRLLVLLGALLLAAGLLSTLLPPPVDRQALELPAPPRRAAPQAAESHPATPIERLREELRALEEHNEALRRRLQALEARNAEVQARLEAQASDSRHLPAPTQFNAPPSNGD